MEPWLDNIRCRPYADSRWQDPKAATFADLEFAFVAAAQAAAWDDHDNQDIDHATGLAC